jgi:hypothetical protein
MVMANVWGIVFMLFLVAHALVGVLMFAGRPKQAAPSWPSSKSWLFGTMGLAEDRQRKIAMVLMALAAVLLIGGALGVLGVPAIVDIWTWLVVAGAAVSALTLTLYFSLWWLGGIAINAALVVLILIFRWPDNEVLGI